MQFYAEGVWEGHYGSASSVGGRTAIVVENMRFISHSDNPNTITGGDSESSDEIVVVEAIGQGVDDKGVSFAFRGQFGLKAPFKCRFALNFDSNATLKCEGWRESSNGGVFGEDVGGGGPVSLHPSQGGAGGGQSALAARVLAKVSTERVALLTGMGFSAEVAEVAVAETKSVEDAIQFLTAQREQQQGGAAANDAEGAGEDVDPTSLVQVSEEAVLQLVLLGFEADEARSALQLTAGNADQAAAILFDG